MPISNQTQLYSNPAPMSGFEGALQGLGAYLAGSAQKNITDKDQQNKLLMSLIPTLASRGQLGSEATPVNVAGIPMTLGGTPQTTAVEQAAIEKSNFDANFDIQARLSMLRQIASDAMDPVKQATARVYNNRKGAKPAEPIFDLAKLYKDPSGYFNEIASGSSSSEDDAFMDESLAWLSDPANKDDPMFHEVAATLLMLKKKKAGSVI